MKRLAMLPAAMLLAGTGLLTAACASGAPVSLGPAPSWPASAAGSPPGAPATPGQSPGAGSAHPPGGTPSSGAARTAGFQVWFIRGGELFVTQRAELFNAALGRSALQAMLNGPSAAEKAAGLGSAVPGGTRLLGLNIGSRVATVDLSTAFDAPASAAAMRLRLGQVVYVLTQFPTVTSVRFEVGGQARSVIGGVSVRDPQTRAAYSRYLPAITVASPAIGQPVSSPVAIYGTAAVFEATVTLRILDSAGNEIGRTFTTATCGTGCRGDYRTTMSYSVVHAEPGTIQVFESSAKDGSPLHVQSIPVLLLP